METSRVNKKFPISINNQQCLGPCYKQGEYIMHPITLAYITDLKNPFCPTQEWIDKNGNVQSLDTCLVPTDKSQIDDAQIEQSFLSPTFHFNSEYFLKSYYNIYSFESATEYIATNSNPLYTNLRIINCAWKVYGSSIDVLNDQLITFYMSVIKKDWIKDIYPVIEKYIYVDKDNIYLKNTKSDSDSESSSDLHDEKHKVEKINYFNKKFNQPQIIYKMLQTYIIENKSNWKDINDHNRNIENHYINYIRNKIINTLDIVE